MIAQIVFLAGWIFILCVLVAGGLQLQKDREDARRRAIADMYQTKEDGE